MAMKKLWLLWFVLFAGCVDISSDVPGASLTNHTIAQAVNGIGFAIVEGVPDESVHTVTVSNATNQVMDVTFVLLSPDQTVPNKSCVATAPFSGNRNTGQWSCTITIPADAPAGLWQAAIYVRDSSGPPPGQATIVSSQLQAEGQDYAVNVTSPNGDTDLPTILSFARSSLQADPAVLDLSEGSQFQCVTDAQDASSIADATCVWVSPDGLERFSCTTSTGVDTTFACTKPLGSTQTGTWNLQEVTVRDTLKKTQQYTANQIANMGGPTTLIVVGGAVCGNAVVEEGEDCENGVPLGETCLGLGFVGGNLACDNPNCLFDTTGCTPPGCGNAIIEPGEDCEAGVALSDTCQTLGFTGGTLACDEPTCLYDTTACTTGGEACDGYVADLTTTNNAWVSSAAESPANNALTFVTYARSAAAGNALVVLANAPVSGGFQFSDASALVRFATPSVASGYVFQAYDTNTYTADTTISWTADVWYRITVNVNVSAETYTVTIGKCDGPATTLITDAGFRKLLSGGALSYYGVWAATGNTVELEQDQTTWTPVCNPFTCDSLGATCGTGYDNGCGGTIDCNTPGPTCTGGCADCTNPDICYQNACCTPSTTVCTDPDPDYECGDWPDGCGGTVNCGSCSEPTPSCLSGTCVQGGNLGDPYVYVTPADVGTLVGVGVTGPVPTASCATQDNPAQDELIENCIINTGGGNFDVTNTGVTLRNVIINSSGPFPIKLDGRNPGENFNGFVIEYSQINALNGGKIFDVQGGNNESLTIRHNEITGSEDVSYVEGNLSTYTFENNYFHSDWGGCDPSSGGFHSDGFQISEGRATTGTFYIRGNYFDPDPDIEKTALIFSTGDNSTNDTDIVFENNWMDLWGAHTIWCENSDSCTVRNNVYKQIFKTALGNRGAPCTTEGFYPDNAYRVDIANAPSTVYECNRYEDGTFIEDQWLEDEGWSPGVTNVTFGCPSYPP